MNRRTHLTLVALGAMTSFALGYAAPAARAAEVGLPVSSDGATGVETGLRTS